MKKLMVLLVVVSLMAFSGVAMADQTTVDVSASIVGTCKFTNTGTMAFPAIDPSSTSPATAQATVDFWCTKGAAYNISSESANGVEGSYALVHETIPAETMPYTFDYAGQESGTGSGPQTPITLTIDGEIAVASFQNAEVGNYSDIVTLTITP